MPGLIAFDTWTMLSLQIVAASVAVALIVWLILTNGRPSNRLPLPPGPPRLPIIGNLHQAPDSWPWRTYQHWSKQYGPIMYLRYGGDDIIMLSSHTAAKDLLDKRSNIYSSRPHLMMGNDVVSKGNRSLLMPYGPRYRNFQRIQGGVVGLRMPSQYVGLQDLESKQLLYELLSVGEDQWMDRFHRYSSSLTFGLAYGKRMPRGDEQDVLVVEQLMKNFLYSARVGTWIVDAIPALNKLPGVLAPWKKIGQQFHDFEASFYMRNLEEARTSKHWNWTKQAESMKESREMTDFGKKLSHRHSVRSG